MPEPAQLIECRSVLWPVGPLFACDHVVKRRYAHDDPIKVQFDGAGGKIVVGEVSAVAIGDVRQHVEIASIGPPRRDLHPGERPPLS